MALVSPELLEKAAQAQSVEELMALAKEAGVELTEEDAAMFLAGKDGAENGEIPDEELDNVAGGSQCRGGKVYSSDPPYRLIVFPMNTCSMWSERGEKGLHTCMHCFGVHKESGCATWYCDRRFYNKDPLNP